MFRKTFLILTLLAIVPCQGCVVGLIAAGVGAARAGGAKQHEAETNEKDRYAMYTVEMGKLNLEREKSGLKPEPLMNFEDWKTGTLTSAK